MKIEKGMILKTRTVTKNNTFGTVLWEINETGLSAPEKERREEMDGVRAVLIVGTGERAKKGLSVVDSEFKINIDIDKGVSTIYPSEMKEELVNGIL